MALVRWEPVRELTSLQTEMNRLFNTFFDTPSSGGGGGEIRHAHALALGIVEVQEHLVRRERQAVRRLELGVERLRERRVDAQHPAPGAELPVVERLGLAGAGRA